MEITVEILLICKIGFVFRAPKKDSNNDDYENFAKLDFISEDQSNIGEKMAFVRDVNDAHFLF